MKTHSPVLLSTCAVLALLLPQPAFAAAQISTSGCADVDASCTVQELTDGGTITVNNILFTNFADVGPTSFGGALIKVTPVGSPFSDTSAGFFIEPVDLDNNPWSIEGDTDMSYSAGLEYDVIVLDSNPVGAATLQTRFGPLNFSGTSFIDGVALTQIDRPGLGLVELQVTCNELNPLDCSNLFGSDNEAFNPVFSFSVLQALYLDFEIITAGGGAIEVEFLGNHFVRVPRDQRQVISSGLWRTSDTFTPDWETLNFDDSGWDQARAPYPSPISPTDLIPGTSAQFIWHDPAATSDGGTGVNEAFLRFSFDLDLAGINAPLSAIAKSSVDDDYDLYVNGVLVLENHDNGFGDVVDTTDIAPYLRHGRNVIAMHAVDGVWGAPYNRGFERVLFDAYIEPAAYINIPILSGTDWLTSDVAVTDWETPDFDDSGWAVARAPYPGALAAMLITDSAAHSIWHDPSAVYDGTDGPVQAWFRYHFDIPDEPAALPVVGRMTISVDDDFDLYVNGVLVHENHDEGFAHIVETVDFTSELTVGHNVIAIHAVDGGWSAPHNRVFERVTVDGLVATGSGDYAADADGDGIVDTADNCTIHHNSAQSDTNGDGYGNACDPDVTNDGSVNFLDSQQMEAIFFGSDADNDLNQDGIVNFADLAILEAFFFGTPGPSALVN